ncbi:MAG: hypothetical protein KAY37_03230, partial [Phycisphaerae bacterium]|nr:hypothetical protein [Phycisphaerae bacterium]
CDFAWTAVTSDATLGYLAFDDYFDFLVEEEVCDVHWWGLSLMWDSGAWYECDPAGMVFEIKFYPDVMGMPDVLNPVCQYTVAPIITQVDLCAGNPLWYFEADLDPCCVVPFPIGWISIQSISSTNDCAFLWFEGMPGNYISYQDQPPLVLNEFDLAFCLTPEPTDICPGDSNCDLVINWRDIDYFVASQNDNQAAWEAMFLPGTPTCSFWNNDCNGDGTVNWRDIDPFVALMNTTCP